MLTNFYRLLFACFLFLLFSCTDSSAPHSFYYWRTAFTLSAAEERAVANSPTNKLYVRLLDIDLDNGNVVSLGDMQLQEKALESVTIIPVFYITNRVFLQKNNTQQAIELILKKTTEYEKRFGKTFQQEIQIDCDWTASTRANYFSFLKQLQQASKKQVTSTLRLHQVKDKALMGVPPVDKVYLMCYSTSSPLENQGINSILHLPLLKTYLAHLEKYPVKNIAVALPLYSWGIVTNHMGKHRIINALNNESLQQPGIKKTGENEGVIIKSGFYFGQYLDAGFRLRVEQVANEDIAKAKEFVARKIDVPEYVYYHLDERFLKGRFL